MIESKHNVSKTSFSSKEQTADTWTNDVIHEQMMIGMKSVLLSFWSAETSGGECSDHGKMLTNKRQHELLRTVVVLPASRTLMFLPLTAICTWWWLLLYSTILRSWADSLCSHVILHEWLAGTAVTWGWNGYRNRNQHRKLTLEKKILLPLPQGFEPATFQSRVQRSNHWAIPAPC